MHVHNCCCEFVHLCNWLCINFGIAREGVIGEHKMYRYSGQYRVKQHSQVSVQLYTVQCITVQHTLRYNTTQNKFLHVKVRSDFISGTFSSFVSWRVDVVKHVGLLQPASSSPVPATGTQSGCLSSGMPGGRQHLQRSCAALLLAAYL